MSAKSYTVGEVARLARVTVRTLHHFDEIGLLVGTAEMFDGFEEFDDAQYADEARERWGDTEAYQESARRTKRYTKEDWARIRAEGDGLMDALAELLAAGQPPDGDEAVALAEKHRQHIDRWFYPCGHAMHVGLADMYVGDPRFGAYFERRAKGLTEFVAAAIRANAQRSSR